MKKKLSMMKQLLSLFILLMQSYGDFGLIPRNCAISFSTCMDKRPIFGQIAENAKKLVQVINHDLANINIESFIWTLRGQKVMFDFDLAMLYGVQQE